MNKFDRRIQAAVAYLFAGEPAEAANEMKSITPDLRERSEVLLIGYEISARLGDWSQARRFARVLRRRYRNQPAMILLLTEAMWYEGKSWEAGSILGVAEKYFPDDLDIQHHRLRHEIDCESHEVALERIERLLEKKPCWLAAAAVVLPASLRRHGFASRSSSRKVGPAGDPPVPPKAGRC